jgi:hypothetical protein
MLGLRNPLGNAFKCVLHGGKKNKRKSCAVPWLSHKAKTELGRPWRPSHEWDWREATPSPRGCSGSPQTYGFLG